MTGSFVEAANLPPTNPDEAAAIGHAVGKAAVALLRQLGDADWVKPTDCTAWDVRALTSHLVAQSEDGLSLRTMLRREFVGRRRYPDKDGVDAHMAVQIDDHAADSGPALVDKFAVLWPQAVEARRKRPGILRRRTVKSGIPIMPRFTVGYLFDVIYNRDLWMHSLDLSRATGRPHTAADHDQPVVAQIVRDLARAWSAPPIALELTGPSGGSWQIGDGEPIAVVQTDTTVYMRTLGGRDPDPALKLVSGSEAALSLLRQARVAL
jgi:uncharacterized protein (TIGR03083 family)